MHEFVDAAISGHVEQLELTFKLVDLEVEVLHLHSHRLVVIDQRSFLFLAQPYLLNEVFGSKSFVSLLLAQSKSLVGFDQFPL